MATDCFMKFTGGEKPIKGECTDTAHPGASGWIEIQGFSLGVSNAASVGSAKGGGGSARADFTSLSITKVMDNATPNLFYVMCHGDHFTKLDIEMLKAGGKTPVVYLKYEFETVFVSSYSVSGGGGQMPVEGGHLRVCQSHEDLHAAVGWWGQGHGKPLQLRSHRERRSWQIILSRRFGSACHPDWRFFKLRHAPVYLEGFVELWPVTCF